MKKGLLSALCLAVLLSAPACCWRKCSPCKTTCNTVCPDECVETYVENVPVTAEREVKLIKKCGPVKVDAPSCCETGMTENEGKPMKKKRNQGY